MLSNAVAERSEWEKQKNFLGGLTFGWIGALTAWFCGRLFFCFGVSKVDNPSYISGH